jgi:DedD protein
MPLSSLFKRKPAPGDGEAAAAASASGAGEPPLVAAARVRARRRLIGAVVLLGVGIIGFPLLFETAPRPIPVDIPIEIPRKDAVPPLALPAPAAPAASVAGPALPPDAGAELPASAAAAVTPASAPPVQAPAPAASARVAAPAAPAAPARAPADKPSADGQRALALLEGTAASGAAADKAARFVVQVGAYTDPAKIREARAKVEKLGLKTYTQVIDTDAGKRTRVRTGPFESREDADAAVRKLKAAGLPGNILAL